MHRARILITVCLLLFVTFENDAQVSHPAKAPRIKVWYSPPSYYESIPSASQTVRPGIHRQSVYGDSPSQQGYYIDVDTTTDGTHQTFSVTTTVDTGAGSFLKAIQDANNNPGLDNIHFSIGSGPQTLAPNFPAGLPLIVSPVIIDGTTQPGYSSTPIIELNGSNLGSIPGLVILAGNSTIRGLIINRCQESAIQLNSGGNNVIERSYIGLNIAGNDSLPNLGYGIHILHSSGNRIGNRIFGDRNVIAGNRFPHIMIEGSGSTGDTVLGNYIGTDKDGLVDLSGQTNGVLITDGASSNSVGGLQYGDGNVISGNEYPNIAIRSAGSSNNIVQGNTIGTGWNGFPVMENGTGIYILNGASNNLIGHTTAAGRNIISGSVGPGIQLEGSTTTNNVVQGNLIGSPQGRDYSFGNADGIIIFNAPNNTIGGTLVGAGNQIRGNRRHGIAISGSLASGNRIEGNLIGDPFIPLVLRGPANLGSGIFIQNAPDNIVGGIDPLARNKISGNGQHGVVIRGDTATANSIQGNLIGDDGDGVYGIDNRGNGGHGILLIASNNSIGGNDPYLGNVIGYNKGSGVYDSVGSNDLIRFNSIFLNDSMGIDLAPHGVTYNDLLDVDEGPNGLQNFPILDSAAISPGSIRMRGRLDSKPGTTYTLDFFRNDKRDRTFFGEGQAWIGSTTTTCDGNGHADINETFLVTIADSQFITATAIDPDGNTSEFSRALCLRDKDGDGIIDCWETQGDGIDVNADGIIDLDLWAKGARPDHKDIFVEVDYMVGLRPQTSALEFVKSSFAGVSNILLNNPDGGNGINLHIESLDSADVLPLVAWGLDPWPAFQAARIFNFGTLAERTNLLNGANILAAKELVYRYCIFADRFNGTTSGKARVIPGNDFIVSLGAWGIGRRDNAQIQAGTFMHELGHTLGLLHGGTDGIHYKPNYYSIMNYAWQYPRSLTGIDPLSWKLDYSPTQLTTLDENNLAEFQGFGLLSSTLFYPVVKIPYARPNGTMAQAWLRPNAAVDWDGNGDSSGFSSGQVNINNIDPDLPSSPGEQLVGFADWPNLQYNFRNTPGVFSRNAGDSLEHEITEETYDHLLTLPPYGIVSPLVHWSSDPNLNIPISTAPASQGPPLVAGDGEGGAYTAWSHNPGFPSPTSVWAQRVDAFGAVQWMNNGVPVAIGPDANQLMDIAADGQGNAILTWVGRRTGSYDIIVQKINRFGQGLWGNGVSITTVVNDAQTPWPKLTSDGQGGAIIVWMETHSGSGYMYAQRIGASGDIQWALGGVLINSTGFHPAEFKVAKDATGGVIIVWTDKRGGPGNGDIYAQRVSATGLVQWTTNGVRMCDASGDQREPVLVSNGVGGAIVTWRDFRTGPDIYAQHVDSSGQTLWTTNGNVVVSGAGLKSYCGIVTDGAHGAIVSWLDERRVGGYRDAYAQRIDSAGIPRWSTNGVAISDTNTICYESTIISDNNRGTIIVLSRQNVFQGGDESHIFAQLMDSTGSIVWARNGVPITLANGTQLTPSATSNLVGGAIIAWRDSRNTPLNSGNRHIYAQNVTSSGGLGGGVTTGVNQSPTREVPSEVSLRQNYPNPFNPSTTIRYTLPERSVVSLTIYNILGQEVATLVNGIEESGEKQIKFNANNLASGVYFYRLTTSGVGTNIRSFAVKKMMVIQ